MPGSVDGGETGEHLLGPADGSGTRDPETGTVPVPVLTELTPAGPGARIPVRAGEVWIGRDPACAVCRPDDRFVAPRHVKVDRHPRTRAWRAWNNKTENGLWVRVPQITVDRECAFQIGEQRFRLKV